MGWVYLDDAFTEHPKVIEAGGDASWLLVCAISYCNRNLTGGVIPKAKFRTLSDRKNVTKLIHKLLQVGLLEESENGYEIHDYQEWQRSSHEEKQRRVEKAKKAAQARWAKDEDTKDNEMFSSYIGEIPDAPSNAQACTQAMPEQCLTDAKAMPRTRGPHFPLPTSNLSSSSEELEHHEEWEDEDVFKILANRAFEHATYEIPMPRAWKRTVANDRKDEFGALVIELRNEHPDWTATEVADALEPPPTPEAIHPSKLRRPECLRCGGRGVLDDTEPVMRCPDCTQVAAS